MHLILTFHEKAALTEGTVLFGHWPLANDSDI